jgi:hypothetical protein
MWSPARSVAALVLSASTSVAAECPLDDPAVATARAAVEATCPCAAATSSGGAP